LVNQRHPLYRLPSDDGFAFSFFVAGDTTITHLSGKLNDSKMLENAKKMVITLTFTKS